MSGTRGVIGLAIALALCPARPAVSAEDPLARRTFSNADQLMREGKIDQALREFEQVANAYPESDVADDAIYRMGGHYYQAESIDQLGGATAEGMKKAKDLFTKITSKYPREETAPQALLKLGLMALEPRNPERNLDEAYAAFSGVLNIYPASAFVDRALFGAGYADFSASRYDKAIGSFIRAAEEYPRGPVAADARYFTGLAHARRGEYLRAVEELQAGRDLYPDAAVAARGLDLVTRIFKLKMLPEIGGRSLFAPDTTFAPALEPGVVGRDVALAVDPDNLLHVLDIGSGVLLKLGPDGKPIGEGVPAPGAQSISVDPSGRLVLAAGSRFRVGAGTFAPMRQVKDQMVALEKVSAAAGIGAEMVALLDDSENEILMFTGDSAKLKSHYRDSERRVRLSGLVLGAEGLLYTIDRRARRILEIRSDGTARVIPSADLQDPVALAADDLGDLYVLDRRARSVVVMSVEGKTLETINSQSATPHEFSDATALAVGPRAEIYVHDSKRRTIIRFR